MHGVQSLTCGSDFCATTFHVKIIKETKIIQKKRSTDNLLQYSNPAFTLSTPPLQKMVKAQSTSITLTPLFCVCSLHPLPLVCYGGGGGSSKSGIKNCIVIETCRWDDPNVSAKVTSVETGDDICTSINAFAVKAERPSAKAVVMCAVIGSSVAAYRLEYYRGDDDDDLKEEHGFKLDLQKVGACQIDTAKHGIVECAGAMGNENGDGGRVAIATETGRLLIYNVGYDAEKKSPLTIILAHVDDKRHSSAICGVFMGRGAGTEPWVATGGKDGKAIVNNSTLDSDARDGYELICRQPDESSSGKSNRRAGGRPETDRQIALNKVVMVRGVACSSAIEGLIYTISCGRRSGTLLCSWNMNREKGVAEEVASVLVSDYPCGCMAVTKAAGCDKDVIAIGSADGSVGTWMSSGRKITKFTGDVNNPTSGIGYFAGKNSNKLTSHDLPVTGVAALDGCDGLSFASVSGDAKIVRINAFDLNVKVESSWGKVMHKIVIVILAVFIAFYANIVVKNAGCDGTGDVREIVSCVERKFTEGELKIFLPEGLF